MAETIQAFVEKIRTEGVQAGRQQADELLAEAKQQAEQIVAGAQREKEKILAEAKTEADGVLSRSQTELQLAARDAALRLRDALGRALRQVLAHGAQAKLTDTDFLGKVLHEIITQYAKVDLEAERSFRINVPEETREHLVEWAMKHIGQEDPSGAHLGIDLKGTLSQAGFEYNATGATVEVTLESVVEVLSDLVGPELREILRRAMAEDKTQ
jgi:V/A-type H+-transporting ATPase subunit E